MVVNNIKQLISLWKAEGNPLVDPRSLPDTKWAIAAIFNGMMTPDPPHSVGVNDAIHLVKGLMEHRKTTGNPISHTIARKRINRILAQLNTLPDISAVLIPEPVQTHRPTSLPKSSRLFKDAMAMRELDRQLLTWCRATNTGDAWLLAIAIRLMTRLGMSERGRAGHPVAVNPTAYRQTTPHAGHPLIAEFVQSR